MGEELRPHGVGPSERRNADATTSGKRAADATRPSRSAAPALRAEHPTPHIQELSPPSTPSATSPGTVDDRTTDLVRAASVRHRRHKHGQEAPTEPPSRRVLPMFTGGLGTIMVLAGLFIAAQISQPEAPAVEVLASNVSDTSAATTTSGAEVTVGQPLGPIASTTTATTSVPETTGPSPSSPRPSTVTTALLPTDPGPITLDSTTTTTVVTETPSTTIPEIGTPTSITTIVGQPEAPSTTQAPTVPVTTAPPTTVPESTTTLPPSTTTSTTVTSTTVTTTTVVDPQEQTTTTIPETQQPTTTTIFDGD